MSGEIIPIRVKENKHKRYKEAAKYMGVGMSRLVDSAFQHANNQRMLEMICMLTNSNGDEERRGASKKIILSPNRLTLNMIGELNGSARNKSSLIRKVLDIYLEHLDKLQSREMAGASSS